MTQPPVVLRVVLLQSTTKLLCPIETAMHCQIPHGKRALVSCASQAIHSNGFPGAARGHAPTVSPCCPLRSNRSRPRQTCWGPGPHSHQTPWRFPSTLLQSHAAWAFPSCYYSPRPFSHTDLLKPRAQTCCSLTWPLPSQTVSAAALCRFPRSAGAQAPPSAPDPVESPRVHVRSLKPGPPPPVRCSPVPFSPI